MGMLNAGGEAWELGDQENGGKTHKLSQKPFNRENRPNLKVFRL